ncbi:MAG: type I-E CRISPR-associated protein Cas6/Cse3/CasE [Acetobacteraceae bacterium]
MYTSCLLIDTGDNPDRPRPGRLWLRNLYHVHQRLCMAFPSDPRRRRDPEFLAPYKPDDFPEQHHLADRRKADVPAETLREVHGPRGADAGFLFRIDPQPGGRAVILVQSATKPHWDYAFQNAGHLLATRPEVKPCKPSFTNGQRLRFRLAANATRRLSTRSLGPDGQPIEKGAGRRVPVPRDCLIDWLAGRACKAGFSVDKDLTRVSSGYLHVNKTRDGAAIRLFSARYDGALNVTDPALFAATLARGIGAGKAFGLGLLSVAPCQPPQRAEAP